MQASHSGLPPRSGLPLSENVFHAFHPIIGVALGGGTRPAQPPTLTATMTPSSLAIIISNMVHALSKIPNKIVFFTNFQMFFLEIFNFLTVVFYFIFCPQVRARSSRTCECVSVSGRCHLAALCPEHGFSPLPSILHAERMTCMNAGAARWSHGGVIAPTRLPSHCVIPTLKLDERNKCEQWCRTRPNTSRPRVAHAVHQTRADQARTVT